MNVVLVGRIVSLWICLVIILLTTVLLTDRSSKKTFYRFGPHNELMVMGLSINSWLKYNILISVSTINCFMRSMSSEILNSWLTNNVRDHKTIISKEVIRYAYEITTVETLYGWVDWFLYMNMLLAQVDMMLIEIFVNLIVSNSITYFYVRRVEYEKIEDKDDKEFDLIV